MKHFLIDIIAFTAIISTLLVITSKNPVISFFFLFVIMMINIEVSDVIETGSQYTKTLPLALSVGFLFIYEIYNIIPFSFNNLYAISSVLDIFFNFNLLILDLELIKTTL